MGEQVRVADVATIEAFRASLLTACDAFRVALEDASQDINRTAHWVQQEQVPEWKRRIRKCEDEVVAAKGALYRKQEIRVTEESRPSVVDERKALERAQARLAFATERLANSKKWAIELPRQAIVYQGAVTPMLATIERDIPRLAAMLTNLSERLEEYLRGGDHAAAMRELFGSAGSMRRGGEAEGPEDAPDAVPATGPDSVKPGEDGP